MNHKSGAEVNRGGRYKYSTKYYDANDKIILKGSEGVVRERYYYGFQKKDLPLMDNYPSAIVRFLSENDWMPVECERGARVYKYGGAEYGGIWAILECVEWRK